MSYVDGFVLVVKKDKVEEYKKMAAKGKEVWKGNGALDYKECLGEDLNPQMPDMPGMDKAEMEKMKPTTFMQMAKTAPDETIFFSFIVYKDRAHRDEVNAKVMSDPSMKEMSAPMPFDPKRVAYGGFEAVVE